MEVYKIQAQIETIDLSKPFITAGGRVDGFKFLSIKVTVDNGSFTVGEAVAGYGENIDTLLKNANDIKEIFISKDLEDAIELLHKQDKLSYSVKAAFDIAFVVLLAQSRSQTLFEYLGAKSSKLIQTSVTINLDTRTKMLQDIKDAVAKRIYILKLKFDNDIAKCVEVTKNAYKLFPSTMLIVDPEQSWSKKETLLFIEMTKNSSMEFIEQPVLAKNIDELKEITNFSDVNIAADGMVRSLDDLKDIIDGKKADYVVLKVLSCGGITKIVEMLEYMRQNSIKCVLGSMLESPFSINATLHLAIAYSDVIKYVDLDSPLFYENLADELEFEYDGSRITYKF